MTDKVESVGVGYQGYVARNELKENMLKIYERMVGASQTLLQRRQRQPVPLTAEQFFGDGFSTYWSERIRTGQVYEILGKAATGKTHFCYELLAQAITKDINVILIDTDRNFSQSKIEVFCTQRQLNASLIRVIECQDIKQLGIALHTIHGHLATATKQHLIIIDCLSACLSRMDYQKHSNFYTQIKKLCWQLVGKNNCSLVYTAMSKCSLYETYHQKTDEVRFRAKQPRQWDSLSNCGLLLDSAVVEEDPGCHRLKILRRCCLTKGLPTEDLIKKIETKNFN